MADIAAIRYRYMVGRHASRKYTVVAGRALLRQFLKHTANVTGLTINQTVSAFEGKSSG
jgi:hypothetical protein